MIGAAKGTRTPDPRITNALLYQLSFGLRRKPSTDFDLHTQKGFADATGPGLAPSPRREAAGGRFRPLLGLPDGGGPQLRRPENTQSCNFFDSHSLFMSQ